MKLSTFRNRLSYKIGMGFSLVALILIGTILYTLISIHEVLHNASIIATDIRAINANAVDLRSNINTMMSAQRDWLITGNAGFRVQRIQLWNNNVLPTLDSIRQQASNPLLKINLKTIDSLNDAIHQLNAEAAATESINSPEAARTFFYQKTVPLLEGIRKQLSVLINQQRERSTSELAKLRQQVIAIYVVNLALVIFGSILCVLLGILLTRTITRPLRQLVAVTHDLAHGNLEQKVAITGTEEFETLSQAFNDVIHTLQEVSAVTSSMAEGNYSHRVYIKSEKDKLGIAVNAMLDDFNQIVQQANAIAEGDFHSEIKPRSPTDTLGKALSHMTLTLRHNQEMVEQQNWLKDGLAAFAAVISEAHDLEHLCQSSISAIAHYCQAGTGAIYLFEKNEQRLHLHGSFAFVEHHSLANDYALGEGIVGQVALEQTAISLTEAHEDFCHIATGVSDIEAHAIYAFPLIYERSLVGVCVLAWPNKPHPLTNIYLDSLVPILAGHIQAAHQQAVTTQLLEEQKLLADQLRTQQEELKVTNEELEEQTQILKTSEEELRLKDEEQRQINKELAERTQELEQQKNQVENANSALQLASKELKIKAEALAKASQYKSEFLANMSHELRTPLNSLLILAKLLADNQEKNLTPDQVESAKIMYNSGQDLLALINDILDLAKVEAGKVEIVKSHFDIAELIKTISDSFSTIAKNKGIAFITEVTADVPKQLYSDQHRIIQIIRNLCANSFKFTEKGQVKLRLYVAKRQSDLNASQTHTPWLAFEVSDTGIGIPQDKQHIVFEAFQQADGTTSRKYGGTGLGLSISRQFSRLLGGKMSLQSEEGIGSTFTLFIPIELSDNNSVVENQRASQVELESTTIPRSTHKAIKKLLIIEDDVSFAQVLVKISRQRGFQCKYLRDAAGAMDIAEQDQPDAILLDIGLPGMDGLTFLDQLKNNPKTKQIPVQVISAMDASGDAIKRGAIGYLAKPITKEQLDRAIDSIAHYDQRDIKNLLLVEDDISLLANLEKLFEQKSDMMITKASTGKEAIRALKEQHMDCIILDLGLPDMSGEVLLHQLYKVAQEPYPAIIIFTGKELSNHEAEQLNQIVDSIVIKGSSASLERLLEETDWFLQHTKQTPLSVDSASDISVDTNNIVPIFDCQAILLVDDDTRNSFALAQALKLLGLTVTTVSDGKIAIDLLKQHNFDLILMDIMMPIMDGYTAIATIKAEESTTHIPIIALTAKAMADDEQKCLDAGADDYITKPIDLEALSEKLRKWLTPN